MEKQSETAFQIDKEQADHTIEANKENKVGRPRGGKHHPAVRAYWREMKRKHNRKLAFKGSDVRAT